MRAQGASLAEVNALFARLVGVAKETAAPHRTAAKVQRTAPSATANTAHSAVARFCLLRYREGYFRWL